MPLSSLLRTGDWSHAIKFAIRHYSEQIAATYISVNDRKANSSLTPSTLNGLSDHGTQFLPINSLYVTTNTVP